MLLTSLGFAEQNFRLVPAVHLNAVVGSSSADHPESFAAGAHDPNRDGALQLQSLEPSLSLYWGEHVQGFATGTLFTDEHDDFEWEWEEIFLKLGNLPLGLELRGGRFLNRVGFVNPVHLHGWETVDAPLPHALFLGDEGLQTLGGEINFHLDTAWPTVLTFSFGEAPDHDHHHGHGHDHHGDHGDHGALEEYRLDEDFFTVGVRTTYRPNDFHAWTGAFAAGLGENEEGGDTWFGLAGLQYLWRENGFEPGGRELLWSTEFLRFSAEGDDHGHGHGHSHGHSHDHVDAKGWGFTTLVAYQATPQIRPFARFDYVSNVSELDLESWARYTFGSTFTFTQDPRTYARVQANFDERGHDSEQAVWLQLGFSWGGPEVR